MQIHLDINKKLQSESVDGIQNKNPVYVEIPSILSDDGMEHAYAVSDTPCSIFPGVTTHIFLIMCQQ